MSTPADRPMAMRRMLLALDAMHCEPALIDAAVAVAVRLEVDIDALFLEDENMSAVAALPITREICLRTAQARDISSADVERMLRGLLREAEASFAGSVRRNRVRGNFRVLRGSRHDALDAAAAGIDILQLPTRRTRASVRPPGQARVFALIAGGDASRRTLAVAARLARQDHGLLDVCSVGPLAPAWLDELAAARVLVRHHESVVAADVVAMLAAVDDRESTVLLVAAELLAGVDRGRLLEALGVLRCQVLVVN